MKSDAKVVGVRTFLVGSRCRTPLKFGASVVEELPLGYARAEVQTRSGARAVGWGAMFLMDPWAWPGPPSSHPARSRAMCALLDEYARLVAGFGRHAHPVEVFMETEGELMRLAREVSSRETPGEEMPRLAALVAASPVDWALHDAFGLANHIDSYLACGSRHMEFDLSRYLGRAFEGFYPAQFLRQERLAALWAFHLVGGLDALSRGEVAQDAPADGLPDSLDEWIERDGVSCLKVKLVGRDMARDLARTLDVARVYRSVRERARPDLPARPALTLDANEQCESPEYMIELLSRLREHDAATFADVLYIEQPTERDLLARRWDMRQLAAVKPVLVDEGLASIGDFALAMELGWSGIALKACKTLSACLLFAALAGRAGVPCSVQDLTCPSIALLQSVGLAARIYTMKGVETNSRQFFPAANDILAEVHPGICRVKDGLVRTESLRGPGLGTRVERLAGFESTIEAADREFRALRTGRASPEG